MAQPFKPQNKTTLLRAVALLCGLLLVSGLPSAAQSQTPPYLSGVVTDPNGAVISNASVRFTGSEASRVVHATVTGSDGRFVIQTSENRGTLVVEAAGFETYRKIAPLGSGDVSIVLSPASVNGAVTVTRTETTIEETSASVVLLDRRDLEGSGLRCGRKR